MYTRIADVSFQHLGVLDGITKHRIRRYFGCLKLGHIGYCIGQVKFLIRNLIGYKLTQTVGLRKRQFLYTCYILNGKLGSHRTVCNNMSNLFLSVLLGYPVQHASSSVIIEVDIDIRQRNTVRVQETLEQQIVFDRVDLRNTQTVGYSRTGC